MTVSTRRHSDPRRLSRLFRGELDWIVMKALDKDRTRRFETVNALAADVRRFLHDEPVTACPPSAWYLFRKFARRRRAPLTMAAVITAALVLMAGSIGWVAADRAARETVVSERDLAVKNRERAEEAEGRARAAERENEVRAHLRQATALRLSREPGRQARGLAEIAAAMNLDPSAALRHDLRNEAIACLAIALDLSPGKEWAGWPTGSVAFDFDGKLERFARSDLSGNVSIRRLKDDEEIGRIAGTGRETWLRFSPDGQFLLTYVYSPLTAKVWKLGDKPPSLVFQKEISGFDFHADRPVAAIGRKENCFEVLDLNSGKSREYQVGSPVIAIAWRPGANQVAVSQPKGVKVYDLDAEQWVADREIDVEDGAESLAWHWEGAMLAVACQDMNVKLWNPGVGNSGKVLALEKLVGRGVRMSFNHRGDLLATTDWGGLLKLWDPLDEANL